jgi:hypothetical protein
LGSFGASTTAATAAFGASAGASLSQENFTPGAAASTGWPLTSVTPELAREEDDHGLLEPSQATSRTDAERISRERCMAVGEVGKGHFDA